MKKILSTMLSVVCAFSLVACSNTTKKTSTDTSKSSKQVSTESKKAAKQADGELTELSFWHSMDGTYAEILKAQVEAFNNGIGKEKKKYM